MKRSRGFDCTRNIAILRTDRIGEVLLSTPVIEALGRRFPKARVSFVTSSYARGIVEDRPDLSGVVTFDIMPDKNIIVQALYLSGKLRKLSCDMAIVLNSHKILHLGVFLAGIKYRVGFNRKWGFLLNIKSEDTRNQAVMHEVKYDLQLLRLIDIYEEDIQPFMPVTKKSGYYVKGVFEQTGVTGKKKIVVMHPGSSNPAKRFPVEKFKEIVRVLAETGGVDVILIGSKDERVLCSDIKSGFGNEVHDLSGLFSLRGLAAALKAADLFITNDNGPMHIAAAVGTKVLALFNKDAVGSNPLRWGPYGKGHTVLYNRFEEMASSEIAELAVKIINL